MITTKDVFLAAQAHHHRLMQARQALALASGDVFADTALDDELFAAQDAASDAHEAYVVDMIRAEVRVRVPRAAS